MEVAAMRVVRWVMLGFLILGVGAVVGFGASLLRPRQYADFSGARSIS